MYFSSTLGGKRDIVECPHQCVHLQMSGNYNLDMISIECILFVR